MAHGLPQVLRLLVSFLCLRLCTHRLVNSIEIQTTTPIPRQDQLIGCGFELGAVGAGTEGVSLYI